VNAGLIRKKVTVRSKKGRTYQRSVMVKAAPAHTGGNRQLSAMDMLRLHGKHIAKTGAKMGLTMGAGRLAGRYAGLRVGKSAENRSIGGTQGMLVGGLAHMLHNNKSARHQQYAKDMRRATFGGKAAMVALGGASALAGVGSTMLGMKAFHHATKRR